MRFSIETDNGIVAFETELSLADMRNAEMQGLIGVDFVKSVMNATNNGYDSVDITTLTNIAYMAYKKANHDGMTIEQFTSDVVFDFPFLIGLYDNVLAPRADYRFHMSQAFEARTKLKSKKAEGVE